VPSIPYADVPRAAEWLERVFGFREREHARLSGYRWEISQSGRDLAVERWELPPGVTRGTPR